MAIPGFFYLYFRLFLTVIRIRFVKLQKIRFELVSSGVGYDHSAHCATTTGPVVSILTYLNHWSVGIP